jgi:hypothetical protein
MTHPDPFAPADSDQHPANFRVAPRGQEQSVPVDADAMPVWLYIKDEPVAQDNPEASVIGQARWEEYRTLLDDYGTGEQRNRMLARSPLEEGEDMPTLAELRQRREEDTAHLATGEEDGKTQAPTKQEQAGANDLAAKLEALKQAGL